MATMKPNLPHFEQQIKERLITPNTARNYQSNQGVILDFDPHTNTATVLAAQPGGTAAGEIYKNVPLPTTLGVQGVAPEVGRPVGLNFKDGVAHAPMVTHYFNHSFSKFDVGKHYMAVNRTPRYLYYF